MSNIIKETDSASYVTNNCFADCFSLNSSEVANYLPEQRLLYLKQLENIISQGNKVFYSVGLALETIRSLKLYLELGFSSFESYCEEVWGIKRNYANKTIRAALVVKNLNSSSKGTNGTLTILPATERQARALTKIKPAQQPEVWKRVVDTAQNGKITAKLVEAVVKEYRQSQYQKTQVENPPSLPPFQKGDSVKISLRNKTDTQYNQFDSQIGIVTEVTELGYQVLVLGGREALSLFLDEVVRAPVKLKTTVDIPQELMVWAIENGYNSMSEAIEYLASKY